MCGYRVRRRAFVRLGVAASAGLVAASLPGCRRSSTAPEPIIIAVRTSNCQAPQFVAAELELYAQRGLDVVVRQVASNTEIIEALLRGDVQFGSLPVTTAIAAIAKGAAIRIVAATGRGSDGLLVRAEDGPDRLEQLRGRRIATIRASILDVLLRQALEGVALRPERDVELVYMGGLGDMIGALRTDQIAATSNTEPFMTEAERDGWGRILHYYTADWPDHPCCVLVAQRAWAHEHTTEMEEILDVHHHAVAWASAHRTETAEIVVKALGMFDAPLVAASLHPAKMRLDDVIRAAEVERMADLMARYGLVERAPTCEDLLGDPSCTAAAAAGTS